MASQHVVQKSVCDIACGAGYGSYYLSQTAREVVGLDVCQEAVDWATQHFQRPNLRFLHIQTDEPWLVDRSFDVVTSFETMEHTESPAVFLQGISDHLMPDGTLIMSIPNGPLDRTRNNPYHLHYFTKEQFASLIEQSFSQTQYFSQVYRRNFRHYAAKHLRRIMGYDPHTSSNYEFEPGLHDDAKRWVVITSKSV